MNDALSFEGNTGPYAQYTYARTCSILDRAGEIGNCELNLAATEEIELAKTLSRFSECVLRAMTEYEPSNITRYILDVCSAFNRFYHNCPILSAESEAVKNTRLLLTKAYLPFYRRQVWAGFAVYRNIHILLRLLRW